MEIRKIINFSLILISGLILLISCKKNNDDLRDLTSEEILSTCPSTIEAFCPPDSICEVFVVIEQLPRFYHEECENLIGVPDRVKKECADEKLAEFLSANVIYPKLAKENNIEGTVVIQFLVRDTIGCLSDIKIVRDIGYGCGIEVQRVVSTMPDFVIGRQRGIPVNVRVNIPYEFNL